MLDRDRRDESFRNVRRFAEACGGTPDSFYQRTDVIVYADGEEYLYENVTVQISYDVGYMQYRVSIVWEDDESQISYKELGLHGYYVTNWQMFSFSHALTFYDGDNEVNVQVT